MNNTGFISSKVAVICDDCGTIGDFVPEGENPFSLILEKGWLKVPGRERNYYYCPRCKCDFQKAADDH